MNGKIIAVISTKGSVGKTTLVYHMAGYLASLSKKILLVDADSQQSLSKLFDYKGIVAQNSDDETSVPGFGNWLTGKNTSEEVILHTYFEGRENFVIDVITNDDPHKIRVDPFLLKSGAVLRLGRLLEPLREKYDYIFIDTEGTDGRVHGRDSIQNSVLLCEPDLILSMTKSKMAFASESLRVVEVYRHALVSYEYIGKAHCRPPLRFIINDHDAAIKSSDFLLKELIQGFENKEMEELQGVDASLLKTVVPTRRSFFENFVLNKMFMHEYKDRSVHEQLNEVIRELCSELFPEITSNQNSISDHSSQSMREEA